MNLDRNKNVSGKGKYALVKLRAIGKMDWRSPADLAVAILANPDCVDYGFAHHDSEFFVIRLKDKHAAAALNAYADSMEAEDKEFALCVREMAQRAENHPNKKKPD
jgi:hypothetical protein